MKSIVTGGAGFIGSNLVDLLLENGHEVIVIDNFSTGRIENLSHCIDKITVVNSDISQPGKWQKMIDHNTNVFHIAALADIVPSIENPDSYYTSNVTGTFNVLEACRNKNIRKFVYTASSSCYGLTEEYPTTERTPTDPQYPYALTKLLGENLVLHWGKIYQLPVLSLRLFNVYGIRSRTSGTYGAMFGVFLAQKLSGQPYTVVGDGSQSRDFIYVSDVCNALLSAANSLINNEIFNIGRGEDITINQIVEILKGEFCYIPKRPGEPEKTLANISKVSKQLNWQPNITVKQGIEKLLENINYWKEAVVWTPEMINNATKSWFKYLK